LAEDKLPSAIKKQEQEKQTKEALSQKTWFALENESYKTPVPLSGFKRLKLQTSNYLLDLQDVFHQSTIDEIETGLSFNLLPVILGTGILVYFAIPAEPSLLALVITVVGLSVVATRLKLQNKLYYFITALAVLLAGMLTAQVATITKQTASLERQITTQMQGVVLGVDQSRRGAARYLIKPIYVEKLIGKELPRRFRISAAAKHDRMLPGETITGLARLQPISGPVYPGGYDFSFFSWHQGMGGSDFFMGRPVKADTSHKFDWRDTFLIHVNRMRIGVEKRIIKAMPDDTGKIAVALVTGNKTHIPGDVQETLRKTGLAHILAISGLHMALVTLTIIWCIRFKLSFIPSLVLKYPIKKWAVCAGFISATGYLMLSGAGIATQRAWIMISVMLFAVLLDRRAITMRSVAISAVIILLINPESLLSPGFQMSFAAVAALVAGYEVSQPFWRHRAEFSSWFQKFTTGLMATIATSVIAGAATAPFAAYHFNRLVAYGLPANVLATPVMGLWIMPMIILTAVLAPFGLASVGLVLLGVGIGYILFVADWIASLEGAAWSVPAGSSLALALIVFGGLWLVIWRGWLRSGALVLIFAGVALWGRGERPVLLVSEGAELVAGVTEYHELWVSRERKSGYSAETWLRRAGEGDVSQKGAFDRRHWECDKYQCSGTTGDDIAVVLVRNRSERRLIKACKAASIVIAPRLFKPNKLEPSCTLIDRSILDRASSVAVTMRAGSRPLIEVAEPTRLGRDQ